MLVWRQRDSVERRISGTERADTRTTLGGRSSDEVKRKLVLDEQAYDREAALRELPPPPGMGRRHGTSRGSWSGDGCGYAPG